MLEGAVIKVAQKKMEDVEEGSSSRKKQKRKDEEEIEVEQELREQGWQLYESLEEFQQC